MTLGECYIVYDIDSDILLFDIERFIFDIERKKGLQYRIRYDIKAQYRIIMFDIKVTKLRYRQPCF